VGCSEDTNGDFTTVGNQNFLQVHDARVGTDVVNGLGVLLDLLNVALLEDIVVGNRRLSHVGQL